MTTVAIPLRDLSQRISQQQAELEKLRKEYEARQSRMNELTRRKEQLEAQLRQVETELQGIDAGHTAEKTPAPAAAAAPKPTPKPAAKPAKKVSLGQTLIDLVSEAGRPITVKELTEELQKRKFSTTSADLSGMIAKRVSELVKKKLLRREKNKPGVLPVGQSTAPKGTSAKAAPGSAPSAGPKPGADKKPTSAAAPVGARGEITLPAVVTQILTRSKRPLLARELADAVRESGYQTKSKDFTKVVWAAIGNMANVEHVKGQGYRLKKGK